MIRTVEAQTGTKFTEVALVGRGLAIIGVVVEHAIGWGFTAMFWWADRYRLVAVPNFDQMGSFTYYGYRVLEVFFAFALPVLFFVSGYFMQLTSQREKILWAKIFSRIKRLIIPFIIWSILTIILDIIQGKSYNLLTAIVAIITGESGPAFYFVPALIQLYLLSPFLINLMKTPERARWILFISAIIQLLSTSLAYASVLNVSTPLIKPFMVFNHAVFFNNHIFWFALGIAAGYNLNSLFRLLERTKWWLLGLSVATLVLGVYEWEVLLRMSGETWLARPITVVVQLYMFFSLLTVLSFRDWTAPVAKLFAYLGSKSYGIYLVHSMVLLVVARLIYHFAPVLLSMHLLYQLILVSIAIAIPVILMEFAARFASGRYYAFLFGRK